MPQRVVFITEGLLMGGTSNFLLNISQGLKEVDQWKSSTASLLGAGQIGDQILAAKIDFYTPDANALIHEERIENIYSQIAPLAPKALVVSLGGGAFEFLRVVPSGCLRIGMIQSDDGCVYDMVEQYLPWLDAIVGVSGEICRKMQARLAGREIPVIQQAYGVPMPETTIHREHNRTLRVLYIGRVVEEQKRISMMARIIRASLEENFNLEWTIAGDGSELDFLKSECASLKGVRFLGAVPYDQVPDVLAQHDAYFLCSDYEGLPLSLLEAMGQGLVPIVSDLPSGISEVVNDENGFRIPIHDEAGYIHALKKLAEDSELRAKLSDNAREAVEQNYSVAAMTRRWVAMLDGLLPKTQPDWSQKCHASAPLLLKNNWRFHPILRPVRHLAKVLKSSLR